MILGYSIYKIGDEENFIYETKAWVKSNETGNTISFCEMQGSLETCRDELIKLVTSEIKAGNTNLLITQEV